MSTLSPSPRPKTNKSALSPEEAALAETIRRAGTGDDNAFTSLYERFHGLTFSIASKIVGYDDAADVAQVAWVKCHRTLDRFEVGKSFTAWLGTIVRNAAIDRKRARDRRLDLNERFAAQPRDEFCLPEIESTAAVGLARMLLERLPPRNRRLVELQFFAPLSARQIADELGLPVGTVKARIRRGLRHLAKILNAKTNRLS